MVGSGKGALVSGVRNPCPTCESALLDKNKCSLGCERRHEYCKHLGISFTGGLIQPQELSHQKKSCSSVRLEHTPYKGEVAGSSPAGTTTVSNRNMGKSAAMEVMADEFMRRNPGAKMARVSIANGQEQVHVTEAGGELRKDTDGIYRAKPPNPPKVPRPPKPPKPPYDWHAPRPMRSKGGRLEKATASIKEGRGNRETCRLTGTSKNTVAKLRLILEEQNGGPFLCSCGRPAIHQGMCEQRNIRLLNPT